MTTYDTLQVDIGNAPNDDQGDPLRTAFDKINQRFAELRVFLNNRGDWAPNTAYTANPNRDWVIVNGVGYLATSNHTSGATFAADLAAGKWVEADALEAIQEAQAASDAVDTLRSDLASTSAGKGAALVAFKQAGAGAAATNAQVKLRDSVSVAEFMSAAQLADAQSGANTLDCTAALQEAINYCLANDRDLNIPYRIKITQANIDRLVDAVDTEFYFTIFSNGGGGFLIDGAGTMFSTTLFPGPYGPGPGSHLIRFHNIRFECTDRLALAYVLDAKRFLRMVFSECSFYKIRCGRVEAPYYWQSYTFINCFVQGHAGAFCYGDEAYDFNVIGGLYQAGGADYAFDIAKAMHAKFYTTIIGYTTSALKLNGPKGVDISCYFESNTLDIDFRTGGIPAVGVNLHGCLFLPKVAGVFSVLWGEAFGCSSRGNVHYGSFHSLATNSRVDINDHAYTALSDTGDAQTNVGYRENSAFGIVVRGQASAAYTFAIANGRYTRDGNRVLVEFTGTLTSTGANAQDKVLISAGFPFPARSTNYLCGTVEVVGSAVNNGISPMLISASSPMQAVSSINCIPANTSGQAFTVRGQLSYVTS